MSDGKFVRFPEDMHRRIEQIAETESRTFANAVRLLCAKGLAAYETEKAATGKAAA